MLLLPLKEGFRTINMFALARSGRFGIGRRKIFYLKLGLDDEGMKAYGVGPWRSIDCNCNALHWICILNLVTLYL